MLDTLPASPAGDFNAPAQAPTVVRYRPEFSGTTGEFFGIWFVNLLLSIATLGIYSAWAKVRTHRYFYANTRLADSSFEYLASPVAILKGRLIAYAVLIALGLSSKFSPILYLILILAVGLLMPAVIVLSLRFHARNSAWRGLSFRFDQYVSSAYGPYLLWGWLAGISLSVLYPVMKKRQHGFIVEGHRFGHKRFTYHGDLGDYYAPYWMAVGAIILIGVVFGFALSQLMPSGSDKQAIMAKTMAVVFGMYAVMFGVLIFLRVRYGNLLWNSARLGPHRFESTVRARDMFWIYFSNAIAILCTIGLAVPWARIRLARYRAGHFCLVAAGDMDDFIAASQTAPGAAGAELADALDVGLDIGF